ncbi:hypothetical protein [Microbacterium sp. NPDC057944]|uniref:hypothetical protein n=1 Tax=Microbacterium sp. NPDC057944 TaxID=3346286 RepID=UPI0036DA539C
MSSRRTPRRIATLVATAALLWGGATAASAAVTAPTPDQGPVAGGTLVRVPQPGPTFVAASQSARHGLAESSDHQVYAWGANDQGQLGDGTLTNSTTPHVVVSPAGVALSEPDAGYGWSLALGSDGGVYAWGTNGRGQLGNGVTTNSSIPVKAATPAGVTFTQPETGEYTSSALGSDGSIYVWGRLPGTSVDATAPVATPAPAGVSFVQLSGGNGHILALGSDGVVYAWGSNGFGQLGNGSLASSATPVAVTAPAGVTFTAVAAGGYFSTALGSDGALYSWGMNDSGQLGVGDTAMRTVPTVTPAPAGTTFTTASAGYNFVLAGTADGRTFAWGDNLFRTLGDGSNTNRTSPVLVQAPSGVSLDVLAAGDSRSLAIGDDGALYAWSIIYGPGVPTLFWPDVTVTAVTFDGIPGASPADAGDGDWSVVTPAHAAGPVDVVVEWTLGGVAQTPVTYAGGFTYVAPPTITDPADATTTVGGSTVFTVTTSGGPSSAVTWEVSTDGGLTWSPISADDDAVVSADGLSVTVTPTTTAHSGHLYRATVADEFGSVTSDPAALTVTAAPAAPGGDPTSTPSTAPSSGEGSASGLASTGGESPLIVLVLGATALLAGAALLTLRRIAGRSGD